MAMIGIALILVVLILVGVGVAVFSTMKGSRTVTWVLAGLLLLVLATGVAVLLMKPSALELEVVGPPGTEFTGEITIDGTSQTISGTAPVSYYFPGRQIQFVVIPTQDLGTAQLEIRSTSGYLKSTTGVRGELTRTGPMSLTAMIRSVDDSEREATAVRLRGTAVGEIEPPLPEEPPQTP